MKIRAFTLIELLIVVAIIAILAAIAVPNFLEAQVRAKVSRAKSDMRSLATGIESYKIDANAYPLAASIDDPSDTIAFTPTVEVIEGLVPYRITTPVAYMSSLPKDSFPPNADHEANTFHYLDRKTTEIRNEPEVMDDYYEGLYGTRTSSFGYWMFTVGPDLDHDEDLSAAEPEHAVALYDPTNGSVSSGDIYYIQGRSFN